MIIGVLLVSAGAYLVRLSCQSWQCWICWGGLSLAVGLAVSFFTGDVWSAFGIVTTGTILGLLYPRLWKISKYFMTQPVKAVGWLVLLLALCVIFFHPTYSPQAISTIVLLIGLVAFKWFSPRRKDYAGDLIE